MKKVELTSWAKSVGWIVLMFIVGGLIISTVQTKSSRHIKDVVVDIEPLEDGNTMVTPTDIFNTIRRRFGIDLQGQPLNEFNIERLERVLREESFIHDVETYIDARNEVHIKLTQRQPVLRVVDKNNKSYYLDKEGVRLPWSQNFTARVLVASGNIPPFMDDYLQQNKNVLQNLFTLTHFIRKDAFLKAQIEQIVVNRKDEFILVPKVGKQDILLGSIDNMSEKFDNLKIFYKEGMSRQGWDKYKTINLKFNGQVICEKR